MTAGRVRLMITIGIVGVLEAMCRLGAIDRFAMPPPSEIMWNLGRILVSGQMWPAIAKTFANVAAAGAAAIVAGVALGTLITVAAVGAVPRRPSPDLCWYWADRYRSQGYWDYC